MKVHRSTPSMSYWKESTYKATLGTMAGELSIRFDIPSGPGETQFAIVLEAADVAGLITELFARFPAEAVEVAGRLVRDDPFMDSFSVLLLPVPFDSDDLAGNVADARWHPTNRQYEVSYDEALDIDAAKIVALRAIANHLWLYGDDTGLLNPKFKETEMGILKALHTKMEHKFVCLPPEIETPEEPLVGETDSYPPDLHEVLNS